MKMKMKMKMHIRGVTDGVTSSGTLPISSPDIAVNFRNYAGANANFITVPVGLQLCIKRIIVSGAPAAGSSLMSISVERADDADAATPSFSAVATYSVVASNTGSVPQVHIIDLEQPLIIRPLRTLNDRGTVSTTAVRFTYSQSTAFVANIDIDTAMVEEEGAY